MKFLKSVKKEGFIFVANDGNIVDRHGERVDMSGLDIESYQKNPVVFFDHDTVGRRPVARAARVWKDGGLLYVELEFNENYDLGRELKADVEGGFLNALSIGFSADGIEKNGVYPRSELLEISLVGVPANQNSLRVKKLIDKFSGIKGDEKMNDEIRAELATLVTALELGVEVLADADDVVAPVRALLERGIAVAGAIIAGSGVEPMPEGLLDVEPLSREHFEELLPKLQEAVAILMSISDKLSGDQPLDVTTAEMEMLIELKEIVEAALIMVDGEPEAVDMSKMLARFKFEKAGAALSKKTLAQLTALYDHLVAGQAIVATLIGDKVEDGEPATKSLLDVYKKNGRYFDASDDVEILVYE